MRNIVWLKILFMVAVFIVISAVIAGVVIADNSDVKIITGSFFHQFVISGGPIVWFVLLPMSLITVYLAIEYSLVIRRARLLPADLAGRISDVLKEGGLDKLATELSARQDLVSIAALKAFGGRKTDWLRVQGAITESLQDQALKLMRRIEWINLIGNVSPMVGLFGTIFGMIKLFNSIVISAGQPRPAQLAEGISVALVTTFWGLLIAIPSLAIYGIFRNRIETLVNDAVEYAEAVLPEIKQYIKAATIKEKQ